LGVLRLGRLDRPLYINIEAGVYLRRDLRLTILRLTPFGPASARAEKSRTEGTKHRHLPELLKGGNRGPQWPTSAAKPITDPKYILDRK
jgi:hypothetical protein